MRLSVSKCGNFLLSTRSQSSKFIMGRWPRCKPSNIIPSRRSKVWSALLVASRSFGIFVFPFREGMYSGNFVAERTSWMSSSMSFGSSKSSMRAYRSSSLSCVSMVTALPFPSIKSLLNYGFRRDMQTSPTTCLSFIGLGVRGDFRISGTFPASTETSFTVGSMAASAILSTKPTPLLLAAILFARYVVIHELRGLNIARRWTLWSLINFSNLK